MTATSVDTAELPRVAPAPPALAVAARSPGRVELRVARRQARRQRQLFALLGLAVLVVALAATVAVLVLDVVR